MEHKETTINPLTGRRIVIGGRTYGLVREELLRWLEQGCSSDLPQERPRVYCGSASTLPRGYLRAGTKYECLKKGFGTGKCSVYRKFKDFI